MTEEKEAFFKDIDIDPDEQFFLNHRKRLEVYDLKHLIVSPYQFFASGVSLNKLYVWITCWIAGASYTFERQGKLLKQYIDNGYSGNQTAYDLSASWLSSWALILSIGLISGGILWWAGGWWYNKRLNMIGMRDISKEQGRRVYMFNRLIHDLPVLVFGGLQTLLYNDYRTAILSEDLFMKTGMVVLLVLLHVSVINSYRSVVRIFPVDTEKAIYWFLVYPMVIYNVLFWAAVT